MSVGFLLKMQGRLIGGSRISPHESFSRQLLLENDRDWTHRMEACKDEGEETWPQPEASLPKHLTAETRASLPGHSLAPTCLCLVMVSVLNY